MGIPVITNSVAIGKALANKNYTITPTSGSLLAEIAHNCGISITKDSFVKVDTSPEYLVEDFINSIDKKELNLTIDKVAGIVRNEVSFIKNTVVSAIKECIESVETEKDKYLIKDPSESFKIVTVSPEIIESSSMLFDEVSKYVTKTKLDIFDNRFDIPSMSGSDIYAKLITICKNYGINLDTLTATFTTEDLENIWNVYFTEIYPDKTEYVRMYNSIEVNKLIIIYLLAKYFKNNPMDGLKVRLNIFNAAMMDIIRITGTTLNFLYDNLKKSEDSDRLILSKNQEEKTAYVCKAVYLKFVKEHDPLVIYGTLVDDVPGREVSVKNTVFLNPILERESQLLDNWKRYVKLTTLDIGLKNTKILRNSYISVFRNMVLSIPKDYWNNFDDNYNTEIIKQGESFINSVPSHELSETTEMAEKLITSILYGATNACSFLKDMDNFKELDSNLSPDECASLATTNLIATYFVGMLTVTK